MATKAFAWEVASAARNLSIAWREGMAGPEQSKSIRCPPAIKSIGINLSAKLGVRNTKGGPKAKLYIFLTKKSWNSYPNGISAGLNHKKAWYPTAGEQFQKFQRVL